MKHFKLKALLEGGDSHLASEAHIRIQVLTILQSAWEHGEVLLIALKGRGVVNTKSRNIYFSEDNQVLINNGEAFNVLPGKKHRSMPCVIYMGTRFEYMGGMLKNIWQGLQQHENMSSQPVHVAAKACGLGGR